jgi:hypothetical protein
LPKSSDDDFLHLTNLITDHFGSPRQSRDISTCQKSPCPSSNPLTRSTHKSSSYRFLTPQKK